MTWAHPQLGGDWLRRLPAYLYVADLIADMRVLEVGCGMGLGAEFLANHGAARVVGIDPRRDHIEAAARMHRRSNLELRCERADAIELEDSTFDCIFVPDGSRVLRRAAVLEELRRLLAPRGYLVMVIASADRAAAVGGASYHEVVDRLAPLFSPVRMAAQSPFVAMSLVQYAERGAPEPGIELDTSLAAAAPGGEAEATDYLAICGGRDDALRGLTIVQLPTAAGVVELAAAAGLMAPPPAGGGADQPALERALRAEEEARRARTVAESLRAALAETEANAAAADEPAEGAATVSEMVAAALAEHQVLVAGLEKDLAARSAEAEKLAGDLARAREDGKAQIEALKAEVDGWRTRATAAEGKVLRLEAEAAEKGDAPAADLTRIAATLADTDQKLARATENWQAAEKKSEELWRRIGNLETQLERGRAENVDTAARQRKVAQAQLSRAMEEASKKLVSVKEDLVRAERARDTAELRAADGERERRDLVAKLSASHERESELSRQLAETKARVTAAEADLSAATRRNGAEAEAEARLSLVAERLAGIERALVSERTLMDELETSLTELRERAPDIPAPAAAGWEGNKEQQLRAFATELGSKDAELALLHVGLSSVRERLREVVAHVREARQAMEGQSAPEMLALMDRLAHKLAVYEGMG